jgi:arsenate reductase
MAEGILQSLDQSLQVHSAGTRPAQMVHPLAVKVMKEIGIDLSSNKPKQVESFLHRPFDFVITVCDNAKVTCPLFSGKVRKRLHIGFDDPTEATGTEEEIIAAFRRVRDEIRERLSEFYQNELG